MAALRNLAIGAIRLTADATSPKQPARQAAICTAPSRFSSSSYDLETTVTPGREGRPRWCAAASASAAAAPPN
jgi:hypothetical protein